MRLKIPNPSDEPVPPDLKNLFDEAGVEWQKPSSKRPDLPNLCPPATDSKKKTLPSKKSHLGKHQPLPPPPPIADRWLTKKFNRMVLDLAIHLNLNQQAKAALVQALVNANLQVPTISTATRALTPVQSKTPGGGKHITGQIESSEIERRKACEIISKYLEPLLDADEFTLWLTEMARSQWSWRGGDPNSPSVPFPVRQREAVRDRQLLIDWFDTPQAPKPSPRELARAEALIQSEPTAPGLLSSSRGTTPVLPLIVIKGQPVPANLFISDVSIPMTGYLTLLALVLRAGASVLDLHIPLLGVAYGMLALALVPVYCLYDNYHGTCTIETLLPKLSQSIAALREYPNGLLQAALSPGIDRKLLMVEDPDEASALQVEVKLVLDAFRLWASSLADEIERSHQTLLFVTGEQSGGRVRTPTQFSPGGRWDFLVQRAMNDGSTEALVLNAPELLAYTAVGEGRKRNSQREHPNFAEIFWLLRAIWEPVATAAALINQAGFTFWINAANNRWGGNHPPHKSHRQGNSLDFDVGFGWRTDHKVTNVKKRGLGGFPLSNAEFPDNKKLADCLHRMERIAGWVGVQAFMLVGVSQYWYGDLALVDESYNHLAAHFKLGKPEPRFDAKGHFDHWHFDILVANRPEGSNGYVWQANVADLLSELYRLAKERDANLSFWQKMAGINKVPEKPEEFNGLPDAEDWQKWWALRTPEGGIPLLPVWSPDLAKLTLDADKCVEPRHEEQRSTEPDETGA